MPPVSTRRHARRGARSGPSCPPQQHVRNGRGRRRLLRQRLVRVFVRRLLGHIERRLSHVPPARRRKPTRRVPFGYPRRHRPVTTASSAFFTSVLADASAPPSAAGTIASDDARSPEADAAPANGLPSANSPCVKQKKRGWPRRHAVSDGRRAGDGEAATPNATWSPEAPLAKNSASPPRACCSLRRKSWHRAPTPRDRRQNSPPVSTRQKKRGGKVGCAILPAHRRHPPGPRTPVRMRLPAARAVALTVSTSRHRAARARRHRDRLFFFLYSARVYALLLRKPLPAHPPPPPSRIDAPFAPFAPRPAVLFRRPPPPALPLPRTEKSSMVRSSSAQITECSRGTSWVGFDFDDFDDGLRTCTTTTRVTRH